MSKIIKRSGRTTTIKDVAAAAGVSLATASRVLSGKGYTSDETRQKVQEAVLLLGYKPNELARSLKLKRTDTIGLIITDIINPFYSYLADGVLDCARQLGYHVVVCATDEDEKLEREYLNVLMEQRAAGIIAVPAGNNLKYWREAIELGTKVVLVDREVPGLSEVDLITVDNAQGAFDAVSYLIRLGHQRIGIINGPITTTTGRGRLEGYQRALFEASIPLKEELMEIVSFKGESGTAASKRLLSLDERPTAIFVTNNALAEATLFVISELGLTIPNDISLIVFDDVPWTSLTNPSITVISQPTNRLGCIGMELIDRRLKASEEFQELSPQKTVLSTELIIRNSCMLIKKNEPVLENKEK
jgi:LacI family transcriptional regulator